MKKTFKLFASVMAFAILTSCGAPVQPESVKANPDPLVVVGNKVDVDITGTFPVKSFSKKAVMTITPVLVLPSLIRRVVISLSKLLLIMFQLWRSLNWFFVILW